MRGGHDLGSPLVSVFAGEFAEVPGKFDLAVTLTRIMFPYLLLIALAAQAMGILNANNRFGLPALASTFFNLGSLLIGLAAGYWIGPNIGIQPIEGMAYGIVFGGACNCCVRFPRCYGADSDIRPALDFSHPGLRRIFVLMGPALVGSAAVQVNTLVNTSFAAGIVDSAGRVMNGPVSWLLYSFRFMQLPLGLFGVAIASATLPAISRSACGRQHGEFRRTLSRSLGMVFLLTVPSAVGLAVLGEPMVGAIYEGGKFTAADVHQTALALGCYAVGLTGYAAIKTLAPAFYALGDARTPMIVSLVSVGINYLAASTMVGALGQSGLALTTSFVSIFSFIALLWAIRGTHRRD
jgi:putative peptidoglycan lipid II flippase